LDVCAASDGGVTGIRSLPRGRPLGEIPGMRPDLTPGFTSRASTPEPREKALRAAPNHYSYSPVGRVPVPRASASRCELSSLFYAALPVARHGPERPVVVRTAAYYNILPWPLGRGRVRGTRGGGGGTPGVSPPRRGHELGGRGNGTPPPLRRSVRRMHGGMGMGMAWTDHSTLHSVP